MERNRERRLELEASLQETFENQLRVALIQSVDLRYSRMRGSGKPLSAHGTSEVEPRRSYVLCSVVMALQGIFNAIMLFAGICIGFVTEPFTHGVSICSNNGSNNGNQNYAAKAMEEQDQES